MSIQSTHLYEKQPYKIILEVFVYTNKTEKKGVTII